MDSKGTHSRGLIEDGLARYFRADSSTHLVTKSLKKARFSVTRVTRETPDHGFVDPIPAARAFSVVLQLRDQPQREFFVGGRFVDRKGYGARTTSIVDIEEQPSARIISPFDTMLFLASRAALDDIADDYGARRITGLHCERGVLDETVWHLGRALLPALEHPREVSQIYADHLLLSSHTYFAIAFGGMRLPERKQRGGLAPRQLHRVTDLIMSNLSADISLTELAATSGLSVSYFTRAFKLTVGEPPHRWLLRQRVEGAKRMMRESALTLSEIAIACGFADQSHLTRVFGSMVGISPGVWRRETRH